MSISSQFGVKETNFIRKVYFDGIRDTWTQHEKRRLPSDSGYYHDTHNFLSGGIGGRATRLTVRLSIKESANGFIRWLRFELKQWEREGWPAIAFHPMYEIVHLGPHTWEIDTDNEGITHILIAGMSAFALEALESVIHMELCPYSERLDVVVSCDWPFAYPFFHTLLATIGKGWSEISEQIAPWVEKDNNFDKKIEELLQSIAITDEDSMNITQQFDLVEQSEQKTISQQITPVLLPARKGEIPKFVAWLGDETTGGSQLFPYGDGHIIVNSLPAPWPTFDAYPILELPYAIITPGNERIYFQTWIIRFFIKPAGDGLFTIRAEYKDMAIKPYFDYLIQRIEEDWPPAPWISSQSIPNYGETLEKAAVSRQEVKVTMVSSDNPDYLPVAEVLAAYQSDEERRRQERLARAELLVHGNPHDIAILIQELGNGCFHAYGEHEHLPLPLVLDKNIVPVYVWFEPTAYVKLVTALKPFVENDYGSLVLKNAVAHDNYTHITVYANDYNWQSGARDGFGLEESWEMLRAELDKQGLIMSGQGGSTNLAEPKQPVDTVDGQAGPAVLTSWENLSLEFSGTPNGFKDWLQAYLLSLRQSDSPPLIQERSNKQRKDGSITYRYYLLASCWIDWNTAVIDPYRLQIMPHVHCSIVDTKRKAEALELCNKHIADLVQTLKRKPSVFSTAQDDLIPDQVEQVRIVMEAQKYKVQRRTIKRWEEMAGFINQGFPDTIICEILRMPESTLRDNKSKMKKKGYWKDKIKIHT